MPLNATLTVTNANRGEKPAVCGDVALTQRRQQTFSSQYLCSVFSVKEEATELRPRGGCTEVAYST